LSGAKLTLVPNPGDPPNQPNLPTSCVVEAAAASASEHYAAPVPVRATIKIEYPDWKVDARSPGTISYAQQTTVTVTIRESSGDTLGIDVSQIDGAYQCDVQSVSPSAEAGVPAGTTTFKAVIALSAPPPEGYTCEMQATALPPDWQDPNGGDHDTFTITVVK
jgi:hypothetical protein